ncbi:MAG TPA: nucleoside phosphorylase [Actinomycetota bacterium]|nr:nucleoside phosphorylase [Actinomycetota bacterium]
MTGAYLTERYLRLPDGSFPHLGIRGDGDVAAVAVVSGSPERVELMASMIEGAERVGDRRGYAVYTGSYRGARISLATSGVGSPSLAIAVEELGACGARTFIRAGSCASVDERLRIGDVAVAHGAVRDEGTSPYYAPLNYPAVGSPRVLRALTDCAAELGVEAAVGLTRSTDSFYEGERKAEIIERWSALGVQTFEMETSALFTVAGAMGWEAGSLLVAGSNLLTGEATYRGDRIEEFRRGQDRMLEVALGAAAALAGGAP